MVDLKPVHLGLNNYEYLVEFTMYFVQVPVGCTVVDELRVHVDIDGRVAVSNEWVISNSTTATTIFNTTTTKIPQSGY